MSVESHREFLTYAEQNRIHEQLEKSLDAWIKDKLGVIRKEEVAAEDITLAGYVRKNALLKFLPAYTTDIKEAIEIVKEIDLYTVESETASTNIYIKLLRNRIHEQVHLSDSISNTVPGLHYVYDLKNKMVIFANKNYLDYFSYTLEQLHELRAGLLPLNMHPDDIESHNEQLKKFDSAADKEIISWEYRLKNDTSNFRWMRNSNATVFARDLEGHATEIIGIILDIQNEKKTAAQLAESERKLIKANEIARLGNWTWDLLTGKIEWSEELYKIYGLPAGSELSFEEILSFNRPEDNVLVKQRLKTAKETHQPSETIYHITTRDGIQKVLHAKTETHTDASGAPVKMIGIIQDITEKQLLIEQLQQSEALYKQAQAIGHIGNWTWDMATRELNWSDEIYHIYELEPQSLKYSFLLDQFNHTDDQALIMNTIKQAIETQQPFDFTYRIKLPDGKTKILRAKGEVEYGADKKFKIFGTLQDITEQKAAEQQLKDYKEFIEKITDVTPSIIAAYNIHTGKYSFINDAIEKQLGYPTARILEEGATFVTGIIHPDDLPVIMEKNAAALEEANKLKNHAAEPVAEFKYRMMNTKGEYRWFHTYGTVFERNKDGLVESVLNVSVDITDQELCGRTSTLYEKTLRLQQSNTSLEEYAYVASHDLKEPLRKITTFSDRLLTTQYESLNEEGKTFLRKIVNSATSMQTMINDLLSVSTILGNNAFEPCNLNTVLEEALLPLDHKIEELKATVAYDKLPTVSVVLSHSSGSYSKTLSATRLNLPGRTSRVT